MRRRSIWFPRSLRAYGVAIAAVGGSYALRSALDPILGPTSPYLFFVPSILVASWGGGVLPGIMATCMGAILGAQFLDSRHGALLHMLVFGVTGFAVNLHTWYLRDSREHALHQAAELAQLSDRKDSFLAQLAHELRNPIGAICNALQVIAMAADGDPIVSRARQVIDRQVRHMRRLLDDLFDLQRLTRGEIPMRQETFPIKEALTNALETCKPFMEARRHEVPIKMPEEDPIYTTGDQVRIEQVLVNLLTNACKYTPENGQIVVSLTRQDGHAVCSIRDNGRGIRPELLPHIWDEFVQGERSSGTEGGLGIGLALVKKIVELHGGTVAAFSGGEGHGSEFVVRLPVLAPAAAPKPVLLTAPPVPLSGGGARILIVEDNMDAGQTLGEILEMLGHTVHLSLDASAAIEWLLGHPDERPEVALLDIGLPGMSGHDLARLLKEEFPEIKLIIALTGYGQERDRRDSWEAGCDLHLTKPINANELERVLSGLRR